MELIADATKLKSGLAQAGGDADSFGSKAAKALAIVGGTAGLVKFGTDSVKAFTEARESQDKLELALKNSKATVGVHADAFADLNTKLAKHTLADDDVIAATEAQMVTFGASKTQIESMIPTVLDFAAKMGVSAPEAADLFDKASLGSVKALKALGIEGYKPTGDKANDLANIQGLLADRVKGAAQAQLDAAGPGAQLKKHMDELEESVGKFLVPALQALVNIGITVTDWLTNMSDPLKIVLGIVGGLAIGVWALNAAQTAWAAITEGLTGAQAALNLVLSMNPIGLIVIAVAALAAGLIVAYKNSETFRTIVNDAFDTVRGAIDWAWQRLQEFGNLLGSIPSKVSGLVNSIPGAGIVKSIGHILGFAAGGTVPGPVGAPMLAVVHGGESVIPRGMGMSGGTTVNVYVDGSVLTDGRDLADVVHSALLDKQSRAGSLAFT